MKLIKMLNLFQPIEFSLSKFDRLDQTLFFWKKRKTLKINAPNSFFQNEPKFLYIILDFFNKFLKTWSWTSWQKKSGDLDLEDRIWRLEFGKTQFSCFEAAIWRMNFKACTFERLALIFGFGRGAQVVKTSPFWKWIYTAQASTLGVFIFYFGTLQALGSHQNPRYWKKT